MLDAKIRPLIDRPLNILGQAIAATGVSANNVTVTGFAIGLMAMPLIWQSYYTAGLICIVLNRLADGIDGAIARLDHPTDVGAYLDIVLDFIFYSSVIFGFVLSQPEHAIYGALLIFSFIGTGSSFLAFAIFAEKHNLETTAQGEKSFYYLSGIAEGTETIAVLVLMCLFPEAFWIIALIFALVCWLSTLGRVMTSISVLRST